MSLIPAARAARAFNPLDRASSVTVRHLSLTGLATVDAERLACQFRNGEATTMETPD
jgi:hypothetical protein